MIHTPPVFHIVFKSWWGHLTITCHGNTITDRLESPKAPYLKKKKNYLLKAPDVWWSRKWVSNIQNPLKALWDWSYGRPERYRKEREFITPPTPPSSPHVCFQHSTFNHLGMLEVGVRLGERSWYSGFHYLVILLLVFEYNCRCLANLVECRYNILCRGLGLGAEADLLNVTNVTNFGVKCSEQ